MQTGTRWVCIALFMMCASPALAIEPVGGGGSSEEAPPGNQFKSNETPTENREKSVSEQWLPPRPFYGLGGSALFWERRDKEADQPQPGITFTYRNVYPMTEHFGVHSTASIMFHDFEAMGDAYGWYAKEPEVPEDPDEEPQDYRLLKYFLLFPGLLLIPFAGANYYGGGGLTLYTSPEAPSLFVDVGFSVGLMMRPSDEDFIADMGIGGYGGVGFQISRHFALYTRVHFEQPFVRLLLDVESHHALSGTFSLMYVGGDDKPKDGQ